MTNTNNESVPLNHGISGMQFVSLTLLGAAASYAILNVTLSLMFASNPVLPMMLAIFIPMLLVTVFIANMVPGTLQDDGGLYLKRMDALPIFLVFACAMLLTFSSSALKDSSTAFSANTKMDYAAANTVANPKLQPRLKAATKSLATFKKDREFVSQIASSGILSQNVIQYMLGASALGLDTSFVADNGLVRAVDEKALLSAAIAQSKSGNQAALSWLSRNGHGQALAVK